MSAGYRAISWNRQKKIYDFVLIFGVLLYLGMFIGVGPVVHPSATIETLLIRGLGTAAFLLLTIVLCIGPLCRLNPACLPLLYNRRHLGVTMFLLALGHGVFSAVQFHSMGNTSALRSILLSNQRFTSVADFPFQQLGLLALFILFLMASTSHDFWLRNLTAPVWKLLHMLVYAAYALLVAHVALGALQSERSPILAGAMIASVASVLSLHLAAAQKEGRLDRAKHEVNEGYVEACRVSEIKEDRARIVCLSGERVAIFKYDGKLSAISNVCQHQNGPLGEGRIIDGCVTCPWHGYQYVPETGSAPPPFTEKIPTFNIRVDGDRVFVDPRPNPPGTRVEPTLFGAKAVTR
jgi:methionine sulfoxide reductase heme-binding subunit